ncbi:MAG: SHOCT domain-containing protein [Candidatus Bathyarchaeia archaeon]
MEVPKSRFCIYCGTELVSQVQGEEVEAESEAEIEGEVETRVETRVQEEPILETEEELMDAKAFVDGIVERYKWKTKLVGVLCSGEISRSTFDKLYDEYTKSLNEFSQKRRELLDKLSKKKAEYEEMLSSTDSKMEELRVRQRIGEISKEEYEEELSKLRPKNLEKELEAINSRLEVLENVFGRADPDELKKLDNQAREGRDSLGSLLERGELDQAAFDRLKGDLDQIISLLGQALRGRKETEEELKEDLETIRARYAVGEISLTEYEKRKKEIEEKLKGIWSV